MGISVVSLLMCIAHSSLEHHQEILLFFFLFLQILKKGEFCMKIQKT